MAKIYYGVAGEGRGHATRARTVIEALRSRAEIVVYSSGDAHELLSAAYHESDVQVRKIAGLRFGYARSGALSPARTCVRSAVFLSRIGRRVRRIREDMERDEPDLVVTDFEPLLPRAARILDIPFVSLDHQHFLTTSDFSGLPSKLRRYATVAGAVVRLYYRGQEETIVSSFHHAPPREPAHRADGRVTRIGVLLRKDVREATPENRGHLVAYLRRSAPTNLLDALSECGLPVRVYGLGGLQGRGRLSFRAIHETRFVEDLATAEALVTTAGNQLVGEALHLGKPVLALPETGNYEQAIHGHFVRSCGGGDWHELDRIGAEDLVHFLGRLDRFRSNIDRHGSCGNDSAVAAIERYLPRSFDRWLPERPTAPTSAGRLDLLRRVPRVAERGGATT